MCPNIYTLPVSQVPFESENPGQQTTDEHSLVTVLFTITVEYSVLKSYKKNLMGFYQYEIIDQRRTTCVFKGHIDLQDYLDDFYCINSPHKRE